MAETGPHSSTVAFPPMSSRLSVANTRCTPAAFVSQAPGAVIAGVLPLAGSQPTGVPPMTVSPMLHRVFDASATPQSK